MIVPLGFFLYPLSPLFSLPIITFNLPILCSVQTMLTHGLLSIKHDYNTTDGYTHREKKSIFALLRLAVLEVGDIGRSDFFAIVRRTLHAQIDT
jgi:hypothetical protein